MGKATLSLGLIAVVLTCVPAMAAPEDGKTVPIDKELLAKAQAAVDRGLKYLDANRDEKGNWRDHPGITGIVALAFMDRYGDYKKAEPFIGKPLAWLLSLQKPNGGIYEKELANYITAISVEAFAATKNPKFKKAIEKAGQFLVNSQMDEDEKIDKDDPRYGGWSYGPGANMRPDLSNAQSTAAALKAAGLKEDSETWKKLTVFLSRCQNRSESNDQEWAKKGSNDGGAVYGSSVNPRMAREGGGMRSYGSMTYAFLKSMIYAHVKKDDPRVQAAYDWIRKHYSLEENPEKGQQGLYYYYHTMAKTLDAYGEETLVDAKGVKHEWRKELIEKLLSLQKEDGSWANTNDRYWERDPVLVTAYGVLTLEAAMGK